MERRRAIANQATCIANIGPRERRKRLIGGLAQLALAVAALAALIWTGASRLWRVPLWLAFWLAGLGYFQWREKT